MKCIRCILVTILLSMLLSGCWGSREIEHMIYANTVGIDYENDKFVIYVQMVNFSGIAKRESGGAQSQKIFIGKAQGDSVASAIFNLYATSPQRIVWSTIKSVVFSEEALKHGTVDQVLEVWDRYYEFRYTVWVMATKEPMEEVLNTTSISELSVIYSQLNNPMKVYGQDSVIEPLYLYKFIWKWKEKGEIVQLPYLKIMNGWTDNKKPSPNLSMSGVCFLSNQKFRGCMKTSDILGIRWLDKETRRTPLGIKDKKSVKTQFVMSNIKSSIRPKLNHGKPVFDVEVSMKATLTLLKTSLQKEKLELLMTKEIKKQIMETYLKGLDMDVDVYGLSGVFYREMPKEWHKLNTKGSIPLDTNSIENIDIKVNFNSGGISKMR